MTQENKENIEQKHSGLPLHPRRGSPERVYLTWDISWRCNYNCSYCNTHKSLSAKDAVDISLDKIKEISSAMYKKYSSCHIRFSGGEPFVYPNFIQMLQILSEYHGLEVSTNLSWEVNDLIGKLPPENLVISSSFHSEFVNFHEFLKKVLILKENKFKISVTFVAYPPFLQQIDYYKEILEKHGIQFIIQPFRGKVGIKDYPDSYTEADREVLKKYVDTSLHKGANQKLLDHSGAEEKKTKICRMGQMYARIDCSGDVFRCCSSESQKLGNILNNGLELLEDPADCQIKACPCWKAMIPGEEERWLNNWEYPRHPEQYVEEGQIYKVSRPKNLIATPGPKALFAPHRVFITWDTHYRCNYKCSYCNANKDNTIEARYPRLDKMIGIWKDIYNKYGPCEIHLAGGEPFVYPYIFELITQLSKIHTLEFSTNLYWDPEVFIANVSPERARIGVSFHPEHAEFGPFLAKALKLKNSGFEVWMNYVGYPPILAEMPKYKAEVEKTGMHFSILPFNGNFEGRVFPDGYSEAEKNILYCDIQADLVNKKTMDWKAGEEQNSTRGRSCRMGQMYAKIHANGEAYRCCGINAKKLGNLFDGTLELLKDPAPCDCEKCPCWKCMLVGKEEHWSEHWVIPHKQERA
jgi:MoaA/NifB/PqqE/SkfB family radical SAM enzyme